MGEPWDWSWAVLGVALVFVSVTAWVARRKREKATHTPMAELALQRLTLEASTKYDRERDDHEQRLHLLWAALMPGQRREARKTHEWGQIGFQGRDPATDFRGMGTLGLESLIYFAQHHSDSAQSLLSRTQLEGPTSYPFAVAGINIAQMTIRLLREKPCVANALFVGQGEDVLCAFGELFTRLWLRFDAFWCDFVDDYLASGKPPELAVMQFSEALASFWVDEQDEWDLIAASDKGKELFATFHAAAKRSHRANLESALKEQEREKAKEKEKAK